MVSPTAAEPHVVVLGNLRHQLVATPCVDEVTVVHVRVRLCMCVCVCVLVDVCACVCACVCIEVACFREAFLFS